ncbi:hypothetical protein BDW22DRAFT_1347976 [Trametopsis cervina]|nr:hypothetical protein BDW22DRAFT_1347976 [Trametopsis cervina]
MHDGLLFTTYDRRIIVATLHPISRPRRRFKCSTVSESDLLGRSADSLSHNFKYVTVAGHAKTTDGWLPMSPVDADVVIASDAETTQGFRPDSFCLMEVDRYHSALGNAFPYVEDPENQRAHIRTAKVTSLLDSPAEFPQVMQNVPTYRTSSASCNQLLAISPRLRANLLWSMTPLDRTRATHSLFANPPFCDRSSAEFTWLHSQTLAVAFASGRWQRDTALYQRCRVFGHPRIQSPRLHSHAHGFDPHGCAGQDRSSQRETTTRIVYETLFCPRLPSKSIPANEVWRCVRSGKYAAPHLNHLPAHVQVGHMNTAQFKHRELYSPGYIGLLMSGI